MNIGAKKSGSSIIRWWSSLSRVMRRMHSVTGGPSVRFGTKCPSMISTWSVSMPAASTVLICSPRRAKSAARIDGRIWTTLLCYPARGRATARGHARTFLARTLLRHPSHPPPRAPITPPLLRLPPRQPRSYHGCIESISGVAARQAPFLFNKFQHISSARQHLPNYLFVLLRFERTRRINQPAARRQSGYSLSENLPLALLLS